jgi:hypothetical protein
MHFAIEVVFDLGCSLWIGHWQQIKPVTQILIGSWMEQTNVNPETWVVDSIHESVQIALHSAPGIYPLRLFIDSAYNLL